MSVINETGKRSRIALISDAFSTGISLNNITRIHVLTPPWRFAMIEQAVARGIRMGSHQMLLDDYNEKFSVK